MAILEIQNLKKAYPSPKGEMLNVIDINSFELEENEEVALQGGSGCGKTTLLHLIAGVLRPDSGSICISKQDISKMRETKRDTFRAKNIGYIFQTFNLLQGFTAYENVVFGMTFGGRMDKIHAKRLLEQVCLIDRIDYMPSQLSVGQQQRVAVARALVGKPKLVLADEPTGNLDSHLAQESMALIRRICKDNRAALIVVSHDQNIVRQFQTVIKLADINRAVTASNE